MTAAYDHAEDRSWFDRAIAVPVEHGEFVVDGARITFRAWGESGDRDVVLVHGSAAHSRWWDHVGPYLAASGRVVAVDLSGHGRSDHRRAYDRRLWADEAMAAARGLGSRPILVGHSLGGFVVLDAATRFGDELGGVIVVDSPVRARESEARLLASRAARPPRTYSTPDELVARFRPLPEYRRLPDYLSQHVARHSVRPLNGGYAWHFDPEIFEFTGMTLADVHPVSCPAALIRGESGALRPGMSAAVAAILGPRTVEVTVPDAGHSVMLDQPQALTTAIAAFVGAWSATSRPTATQSENQSND